MESTIEAVCRRMQRARQQTLRWTSRDEHRGTRTALGRAVLGLPERVMRAEELGKRGQSLGATEGPVEGQSPFAVLKYFVPFKDFFGGWLVYEKGGKLWRQYATPAEMRKLDVGFTEGI